MFRSAWFTLAAAVLLLGRIDATLAQTYPDGPVRMFVGFAAGGSTDLVARYVASGLEKAWGHPVIVENRSGANGGIAAAQLAKMPADGKNLMVIVSGHVTNPLLSSKAGYDAIKDFTPITHIASAPLLMFSHPSFQAKTIQDLIALGKEKPGSVPYATPGAGSIHQLSMELLSSLTGAKFTHVPYRGGGPALNDALAGHVPVSMLSIVQSLPHVQARRINPLAVTSAKRVDSLPDVPAISEVGIPGYEAELWYAVIAPAGLPAAIVEKINRDVVEIAKSDDMRSRLAQQGARPVGSTPAELSAFLQAESDKWEKVIRDANIGEK